MNLHRIIRSLLLLTVLIAFLPASAQRPDVRVSPDEPTSYDLPQTSPSIVLDGNTLLCSWQEKAQSLLHHLAMWTPASEQIEQLEALVLPATISTPLTTSDQLIKEEHRGNDQSEVLKNGVAVAAWRLAITYTTHYWTQSTWASVSLFTSRYEVYRSTRLGWDKTFTLYSSPPPFYPPPGPYEQIWYEGSIVGYDPNRDETLIHIVRNNTRTSSSRILYGSRNQIGEEWVIENIAGIDDRTSFILVDSLQYLRIRSDSATWFREHTPITTYTFSTSGSDTRYQRLLGPYFLRSFWNDDSGSIRNLELYTIDGNRVAYNNTRMRSRSGDMMIVQNPGDSSLTLVYGDSSGVHLTFFNKKLHELNTNLAVSAARHPVARPTAVWRNDTLFAVWQDNRNGNADIYGNWITLTDMVSSVPAEVSPSSGFMIQPNPAHDRVRMTLPVRGEARLEIIDMLSRVVQQHDVNTATMDLDIADLPEGVYLVRCRSIDGTVQVRQLVLAR